MMVTNLNVKLVEIIAKISDLWGDLKILGKWVKGRLESSGILMMGEPVTNEVLEKYGRHNIRMIPTTINEIWYLDFSRKISK